MAQHRPNMCHTNPNFFCARNSLVLAQTFWPQHSLEMAQYRPKTNPNSSQPECTESSSFWSNICLPNMNEYVVLNFILYYMFTILKQFECSIVWNIKLYSIELFDIELYIYICLFCFFLAWSFFIFLRSVWIKQYYSIL